MGRAGSTHTASNWRRPRDVVTPAADGGYVRTYIIQDPLIIQTALHVIIFYLSNHTSQNTKARAACVVGMACEREWMRDRMERECVRVCVRAKSCMRPCVRSGKRPLHFFLLTGCFIMQRAGPCQSQSHSCSCSCSICHAFMRVSCKEVDVVGWWDDTSSVP